MRWPKGPPHLALNPPFCVFVCLFCLGGGVQGSSEVAQRAPHLSPKPSLFIFFVSFSFAFLSLLLIEKPLFPPPPKKNPLCCSCFCVSLCFSLAFFGPPKFHFIFLCLSLVLFFLPCFLFLMSLFGSCCLLLVCLLFVSRCSFFCCFLLVVLF